MTLADVKDKRVAEWISSKVQDNMSLDQKGDWYWTSGTDLFKRGRQVFMNTGNFIENTKELIQEGQLESCYKMKSNSTLQTAPCPEENHFLCHRFLYFFPLV